MSTYGYTKQVNYPFPEAVEKLRASLADQGFGILTEIDVKATMKKKLDKDVDDYLILGACNPQLAAQAIEAEKEIGLLMPCNAIVYAKDMQVFVSAMLPSVAMGFVNNPALEGIAGQAENKLKAAIDNT